MKHCTTGELEERAQSLLDSNRLNEARNLYQQICLLNPSDAESWYMMGAIDGELGQLQSSISCLKNALQRQPDHAEANFTLASIYKHQGRWSEAYDYCLRAVGFDSGFVEAWLLLGIIHATSGNYPAAEDAYRRLVKLQPEHADGINRLAGVQLQQGELDDALSNCQLALSLDPHSPEIHANAGNIYLAKNDLLTAENHFRRALQLMPGFTGALINLANTLVKGGNPQEAVGYFQQVIRGNPHMAEVHLDLGTAYQCLGEFDKAMRSYQDALRISPSMPDALVNIGCLLKLEGNLDAALTQLKQAVRLAPEHPLAHFNLALVCKSLGYFDNAVSHLRQAIEIDPDFDDARLSLSLLELLTGNFADGWKHYRARRSVRGTSGVAVEPLAEDLHDTHLLICKDQGIGDEIFFLRFAPNLKARGARISYISDKKISSLVARLPYIDQVVASEDAAGPVSARLSVGDLPALMNIRNVDMIPPPVRLEPLPESFDRIASRLRSLGQPPYVGVTWWAGTRMPAIPVQTTEKLAHREIPIDHLARILHDLDGTVVVLQRSPEKDDIAKLTELLGRDIFDFSALNDNLEDMLALLALLDDYIGVDNTNMHLRMAVGKGSRIMVPNPPEWRAAAEGTSSPWFPGCTIYRQTSSGDWTDAVNACKTDIAATLINE